MKDGYNGLSWTPDGKIIYTSASGEGLNLWSVNVDGNDQKQLTFDGVNLHHSVSPDGRYLVFSSSRTGTHHIWRMNTDGSNPMQLTDGGNEKWPTCSPDGRWVVYVSFAPNAQSLSKVSIDGGRPIKLSDKPGNLPTFSPDGKLLAFRYSETATPSVLKIGVISFEDGQLIKTFDVPPSAVIEGDYKALRWTPDGHSLAYIDTRTGASNIWRQPLTDAPPKQLTDFKSDRIFDFAWSLDGRRLALSRGVVNSDIVLISNFR
jgi:Tol biopolymer transport system component